MPKVTAILLRPRWPNPLRPFTSGLMIHLFQRSHYVCLVISHAGYPSRDSSFARTLITPLILLGKFIDDQGEEIVKRPFRGGSR